MDIDTMRESIRKQAENLTTPIDFDGLIASGVLEKKGAWYKVNKTSELPEHTYCQIKEFKFSGNTLWVKFYPSSKKLAKIARQL